LAQVIAVIFFPVVIPREMAQMQRFTCYFAVAWMTIAGAAAGPTRDQIRAMAGLPPAPKAQVGPTRAQIRAMAGLPPAEDTPAHHSAHLVQKKAEVDAPVHSSIMDTMRRIRARAAQHAPHAHVAKAAPAPPSPKLGLSKLITKLEAHKVVEPKVTAPKQLSGYLGLHASKGVTPMVAPKPPKKQALVEEALDDSLPLMKEDFDINFNWGGSATPKATAPKVEKTAANTNSYLDSVGWAEDESIAEITEQPSNKKVLKTKAVESSSGSHDEGWASFDFNPDFQHEVESEARRR